MVQEGQDEKDTYLRDVLAESAGTTSVNAFQTVLVIPALGVNRG